MLQELLGVSDEDLFERADQESRRYHESRDKLAYRRAIKGTPRLRIEMTSTQAAWTQEGLVILRRAEALLVSARYYTNPNLFKMVSSF